MAKTTSSGIVLMVKRWLVSGLGVWAGCYFVDGISYEGKASLFWVVLLLGFATAVLKPLLVLMTLPFVVLTLGLGVLLINAVLYLLVGSLVPGFEVASFGAAFFGALFVTLSNLLFSSWVGEPKAGRAVGRSGPAAKPSRRVKAKDDVIDI